ncbi:Major facilitator superfamily domain general substrate transporter [Penicillium expansum]|nr:Major facilitator superfamily domain general substrate transporter [Penicillium expansum]
MSESQSSTQDPEKDQSVTRTQSVKGGDTPETSLVNILVVSTACLGGFLYGFAANALSGSLSQTTFIAKFLSTPDATSRQDGMLGGFLGGALVGAILQAPLSNKFGRRIANAVAALIVIISGALQAGAVDATMFIVARVICGIGAVGLHGVGTVVAYILAAVCALAFSFVTTQMQWRFIFIVLTAVGVIYLVTLYFIPESPRWLMQQGRDDEAKQVLQYLHRTKRDPAAAFAHAEAVQIKAQVDAEKNTPSGYLYIMRTASHRKRALCSILLWTMGQGTGITAIANLIPTLMGALGFGTTMQLGLGVVWTVCAVIGCGINVFLLDRVGRVKLLVIGGFGSAAIISVMAALEKFYLKTTYTPGINGAVAIYFIFGAFFTSTIECTAYVYGSEIWPTHLRSEGATIALVSFFGNAVAYSAPVTLALANIGWKFYMVFVAVTVASTIVIMFYFPETMGLSLEEINGKFGDKVEVELLDALGVEDTSSQGTV